MRFSAGVMKERQTVNVQRCERNTGWKPMLHYAVASPLRVHSDSSKYLPLPSNVDKDQG